MNNEDSLKYSRYISAIELLRYKAESQMSADKMTCLLFDRDINEVLAVAGEKPLMSKDLEVI